MPCESLNRISTQKLKLAEMWRADIVILVGELFVSGNLENSSEAEEESELNSVPKNPMLNEQPCQAPGSLLLARRRAVLACMRFVSSFTKARVPPLRKFKRGDCKKNFLEPSYSKETIQCEKAARLFL
jgi:hypothetical protein